jgi:hypothetical protein
MDRALEARTLGELDELLADLPAIDLYQLPDASLRRAPPHLGQSLLPGDLGGHLPARFAPGTVAMGVWAAVTSALVAIWAVAAGGRRRHLVPLVGADRAPVDLGDSPPFAASRGIAAAPRGVL